LIFENLSFLFLILTKRFLFFLVRDSVRGGRRGPHPHPGQKVGGGAGEILIDGLQKNSLKINN
jgi:hypothetical protein